MEDIAVSSFIEEEDKTVVEGRERQEETEAVFILIVLKKVPTKKSAVSGVYIPFALCLSGFSSLDFVFWGYFREKSLCDYDDE